MKCQAVLLCVLALYLHQGQAVTSKCHHCTTETEARCADPFNVTLMVMECSNTGPTRAPCYKAVTTEHGKKVVKRGCGTPNANYCGSIQSNKSVIVNFCKLCNTDDCNGSSGVLPSALLSMLAASVAVLMTVLKQ